MQKHQRIIDVDDEIRNDDRPQDIPVITIEEDSDRSDYSAKDYNSITTRETKRVRRRIMIFTIVLFAGNNTVGLSLLHIDSGSRILHKR